MIKLKTLLLENYEVTDLRDSAWIPTQYDAKDKDRIMINIVGNKIYLYRWGNGRLLDNYDLETISWKLGMQGYKEAPPKYGQFW